MALPAFVVKSLYLFNRKSFHIRSVAQHGHHAIRSGQMRNMNGFSFNIKQINGRHTVQAKCRSVKRHTRRKMSTQDDFQLEVGDIRIQMLHL